MNNVISLTVPRDDEAALVAGATMLLTLAGKIPAMELPEARGDCCGGCGGTGVITVSKEQFDKFIDVCTDDPREPSDRMKEAVDRVDTGEHVWTGPTGPELDADGLPWDARIHSGSKAKVQNGTWRKRKGVDQADYDRVVEELKQLMAAPVRMPGAVADGALESGTPGEVVTIAPPPPPVDVAMQTHNPGAGEPYYREPTPPPTAVPAPPPAVDTPAPDTFPAFLKAVTMRVQAKELTIEQVNNALRPHGVANLQLLGGRPELIPQVWADLVALK